MRLRTLFLVLTVVFSAGLASHPRFCKYWCKSKHDSSYHCCPSGGGSSDSRVQTGNPINNSMWPILWFSLIGTTIGAHFYNNHQAQETIVAMKKCPPLRAACSRFSYDWYEAPNLCDTDEDCGGHSDKCCYDVCLDHKTCKPAQ